MADDILEKAKRTTARLLFFPNLTYDILLNKCGMREWWTAIDDTVVLGALPLRPYVPLLLQEHKTIKRVLSLNQNEELRHAYGAHDWTQHSIDFLQLPTEDFFFAPSLADLRKGVDYIMEARKEGSKIYVHCKSGRARSATIVAAYIMAVNQFTRDEAIEFLKKRRPFVLFQQVQLTVLQQFEN